MRKKKEGEACSFVRATGFRLLAAAVLRPDQNRVIPAKAGISTHGSQLTAHRPRHPRESGDLYLPPAANSQEGRTASERNRTLLRILTCVMVPAVRFA
jgi:hypothetical protein